MRAGWGAVQLDNAMPTKRIDIKLADNKPTLTLYWMLLKDHSTNGHCYCRQHNTVSQKKNKTLYTHVDNLVKYRAYRR